MMSYYNPYYGQDFLSFFLVLFKRIQGFILNEWRLQDIAPDELQMLVLAGVAASSAIVGSFLVLRKMTMMANSLSHTILLGILLAFLFSRKELNTLFDGTHLDIHTMLIASFAIGLLTTFLTEFLTKVGKLQEDASTGIVFTSLFALGVVLVTLLTRNAHIGVEVVMGNVDALHEDDLKLVFAILGLNILCLIIFFKEFQITTFDASFAKALGISTSFFNYLLMGLVSATIVGAFRAVGVLMVLAFITGPALTSRISVRSLRGMLYMSIFYGVISSILGVALARHLFTAYDLALSTAGVVVTVSVLFYLVVGLFKAISVRMVKKAA